MKPKERNNKVEYVINRVIIFSTEKKTLSMYENDQLITKLSNPASRLLFELVKNNKQNIPRSTLLNNVWSDYGFTASNSGLNNYISELRKAFNSLEVSSEIIITIPKTGFRLDADIDLRQCAPQWVNTANSEENEAIDSNVIVGSAPVQPGGPRYCLTLIAPLTVAIIGVIVFAAWIMTKKNDTYPTELISKIGSCELYILDTPKSGTSVKKEIKKVITQEKVDCQKEKNSIFYQEDRYNQPNPRSKIITICKQTSSGFYSACRNIKAQGRNLS